MIIGTAGHIDHGKTTLVRALTGIDTDRLPEEKRRGISLDLGYAYIDGPSPAQRLGFIDVPGHERLLHTMLAGATGIDHALLLIAADDGVMPQTREHLAVLSLLGIDSADIVITKTDRVAPARVRQVTDEARALLDPTPLAGAPVHAVSAVHGQGIEALKARLLDVARHRFVDTRDAAEGFRLAVDRAFTLPGLGTVATGTVLAGRVQVGDELELVPAEAPTTVRVRSLHAQNEPAEQARRGQRGALALAGLAKEVLSRGQVLCDPRVALRTDRLDVHLHLWPDEAQSLATGTRVHLHLGADDVIARVDLLEGNALAPGASALAQLVSQRPLAAWHGDRLVLRDAGARRTLAGGRVLDPLAPTRHRRSDARLRQLHAALTADAAARWAALVDEAPFGLEVEARCRAEGRLQPPPLPQGTVTAGGVAFASERWQALQARVVEALDGFHAAHPDELGPTAARLKRLTALPLADATWQALLDTLCTAQALARQGPWWHRPGHAVQLDAAEQQLAERVLPLVQAGGFDPPWLRDLATALGAPEAQLRPALARIARRGQIFPVVRDLYYHEASLRALAAHARDIGHRDGCVRAAPFRDATGLGRKRAIQILEFFDRVGLTRRVQDDHLLRADGPTFGAEDPAHG